jgi:hypothetical protein
MKKCTKCGEDKDSCEFRMRGNGLFSWCKKCESISNNARYTPKERKPKIVKSVEEVKLEAKKRMLKYRYGITLEEYEGMYYNQNGKCAICKKDYQLGGSKGLFVDHDHETMEVRGLLCRNCNSAIGQLRECKHILTEAIKYLRVQ